MTRDFGRWSYFVLERALGLVDSPWSFALAIFLDARGLEICLYLREPNCIVGDMRLSC